MKVLVTGASGFIGSSLVRTLLKKDNEVVCLVRSDERKQVLHDLDVKFAVADITEGEALSNALRDLDVDALFHLAAINPLEKDREIQERVNIGGMRNLIDTCLRGRVGLFVYVQGTGVFGNTKGAPIDESTQRNPDTGFAKTRGRAEEMLWHANRENGLPATVTILGDVYGPGGWFLDLIVSKLRDGSFKIPGSGDYFRSFVHVDDVASALWLVGEKNAKKNSTYIVCDDEPAKFGEFVNYVADKLGAKRPGKVPAFLAKMAVGSDMIKLLTYSVRASNAKIKRELGLTLKFPTYRKGVDDTISRI